MSERLAVSLAWVHEIDVGRVSAEIERAVLVPNDTDELVVLRRLLTIDSGVNEEFEVVSFVQWSHVKQIVAARGHVGKRTSGGNAAASQFIAFAGG